MRTFVFWIFLLVPTLLSAQNNYNTYFKNHSLRFDFLLGGNNEEVVVYPAETKQEPYWGGNKSNLVDPFNYGSYRFQVFDLKSDSLIFSKGFSTLFQEWQTTAEAKTTKKTFYQSAIFPFPKKDVKLTIEARQWDGTFKTIYTTNIDPKNYFILDEKVDKFPVRAILDNGKPEHKIDIVILAEGYTAAEMEDFYADAAKVSGYLFDTEPFKSEKSNFNVRAVFAPSEESGTDVPGEHIYKNTYFNTSYYTFDLPRYLTTSDMKKVYDAAASVPYDQIYVLVNTERYGGGGFYNFVTVCTADNELTPKIIVHEFGHGFAGLGDEYYNSSVAYEDFYNLEIEPWEPNITTLVDFDKKWKNMIAEDTPVPTPRKAKYKNTIGVYEGGGYMAEGIYSPYIDCRMNTNEAEGFCPVCQEAIRKVIRAQTK